MFGWKLAATRTIPGGGGGGVGSLGGGSGSGAGGSGYNATGKKGSKLVRTTPRQSRSRIRLIVDGMRGTGR